MNPGRRTVVCALAVLGLWTGPADAQVIGTFRWQLLPYCNVVTMTVTQVGGEYRLDGVEDRCGSLPAGVTGVAFPVESYIAMTFTSVGVYRAETVHTRVLLTLQTLGGTWDDTLGRDGTLTYTPGPPVPGPVRPTTNVRPLGTVSTPVSLAPRACGTYEFVNASVATGDTTVVEPVTVPVGLHLSPLMAGAGGRYAIMICNATASPLAGTVLASVAVRSPP